MADTRPADPRADVQRGRPVEQPAPRTLPRGTLRRGTLPRRALARVDGPAVVAVLSLVLYTGYSLSQWRRFVSPSWDLGIFTQLAARYAAFDPPVVPIKGAGFNLLGDHFHPLLVLLGPVYALFPNGFALLVVQALLLAWSVVVVAREAVRTSGAVAGTLVGVAYAVSFGLVGAVAAQFHEIAFAVPLLALALVALLRERWLACALWAAPLVFVKEDLGLTVAVLGLVLAWRGHRRIGLGLAGWGAGWFVLTTAVIIPRLSARDRWDYGGSLDYGALVSQPWMVVVSLVDDPRKVVTLLLLVAVSGVIGLRSPILLVAVPTLLWRFLADNHGYWSFTWHYSAVLMPIAFAALLDGVRIARRSPRPWFRAAGPHAVTVAVTVAVMMVPQTALADLAHADFYGPSSRATEAREVLELLPEGVVLEADIGLMAYTVPGREVYFVGTPGNPAPDYLLIDEVAGGWNPAPDDAAVYAGQLHPDESYTLVYDAGGYQLAQRVP